MLMGKSTAFRLGHFQVRKLSQMFTEGNGSVVPSWLTHGRIPSKYHTVEYHSTQRLRTAKKNRWENQIPIVRYDMKSCLKIDIIHRHDRSNPSQMDVEPSICCILGFERPHVNLDRNMQLDIGSLSQSHP